MSQSYGGYYVPKSFPRFVPCPQCFMGAGIEVGDKEANGDKEFPVKCVCGWEGVAEVRKYEPSNSSDS